MLPENTDHIFGPVTPPGRITTIKRVILQRGYLNEIVTKFGKCVTQIFCKMCASRITKKHICNCSVENKSAFISKYNAYNGLHNIQ